MNYKTLFNPALSNDQDKSLTVFAGIIGLAAGTAVAVLFAPDSGKQLRRKLANTVLSLFDKFKQNTEKAAEPDDHHITDLREASWERANQLEGPESKRKDTTKIEIPSAGTTNWKNIPGSTFIR
jgi:gas vesicle protein